MREKSPLRPGGAAAACADASPVRERLPNRGLSPNLVCTESGQTKPAPRPQRFPGRKASTHPPRAVTERIFRVCHLLPHSATKTDPPKICCPRILLALPSSRFVPRGEPTEP